MQVGAQAPDTEQYVEDFGKIRRTRVCSLLLRVASASSSLWSHERDTGNVKPEFIYCFNRFIYGLRTRIHSEKCILKQCHHCTNITDCTSTHEADQMSLNPIALKENYHVQSVIDGNVILWSLTICELEPVTLNVVFFFFLICWIGQQ